MRNKTLVFLLLCFLGLKLFSQDYIVTFSKDTIKCKIIKAKNNFVKYSFNNKEVFVISDTISGYKINGNIFVSIAHKDTIPWSDPAKYYFSVTGGVGANHGGFGIKAVIGWKGLTGLSISVGTDGKNTLWQTGITAHYQNGYVLVSYGTLDFFKQFNKDIPDEEKNIRGITMEFGYLFYFGKDNRFFVNSALDVSRYYFTQLYPYEPSRQDVWDFGFGFDIGIGVRF